jgi:putative transposase
VEVPAQGHVVGRWRIRRVLKTHGQRDNCYAHTESFWSRFKAELFDGGRFPGLAEAKLEISHHIACYNTERRHSVPSYLAVNHFETRLRTTFQFCPA